jgi:enoyl-[acyl-carrier protein] reductase I
MTQVLEDIPTETSPVSNLLKGKTGLILGVANKWSIAWAIAEALSAAGMRLAFTYQGDRLEKNVRGLVEGWENTPVYPCDVTDEAQVKALFENLSGDFDGGLDCLVHSVAFAKREELAGEFVNTSREGYLMAQEISSYSLTSVCREALPLMEKRGGGSVVTLTYYGGEKVVPNYNVMGIAKAALEMSVRYLAEDLGPRNIRVNAISAGPIKTLAASGVSGFSQITETMKEKAPMRRNIDAHEVADTALFLASHLSRGITGEVIHVDAGYHVKGF